VKHSVDFPVDREVLPVRSKAGGRIAALPDAPLPMPKQVLEHRQGWLATLRSLLFGTMARS